MNILIKFVLAYFLMVNIIGCTSQNGKVLVNKGESVDTASKYAKDLTVNLNKKGMLKII